MQLELITTHSVHPASLLQDTSSILSKTVKYDRCTNRIQELFWLSVFLLLIPKVAHVTILSAISSQSLKYLSPFEVGKCYCLGFADRGTRAESNYMICPPSHKTSVAEQ